MPLKVSGKYHVEFQLVFITRLHVPNVGAYRVNETDYFDIGVSHFNTKSSFVVIKNEKGKLTVTHNVSNMLSSASDLFHGF